MKHLNSRLLESTKPLKSVRITITTTPAVVRYLQALVPLGLHGSSVAEVAERLICEGLRGKVAVLEKQLLTETQTQNPK